MGRITGFIGQGFRSFRNFLNDNKVFIEVFSFLVLGIAGVYVSYNSYRVSEVELRIHEAELTPIFKLALLDTTEVLSMFKEEGIKIIKESGYANKVKCEVLTYITVSIDSLIDSEYVMQKSLLLKVDYYANCENTLGTKGYISCVLMDSLPHNGLIIEEEGAIYPVYRERLGKTDFSIVEQSIVHLTYLDILNQERELYYDVNRGGNVIEREEVLKIAKECVNEKVPIESLDITVDTLKIMLSK